MSATAYEGPNAGAIEAWDTIIFEKFVRFRHITDAGLRVHGDAALEHLVLRGGARVLDVGCGFGETTCAIARRVGEAGEAIGVDAAPRFIENAAREAKEAKIDNARFLVRDAQTDDLGGPYDVAFSRFGTMFFASAVNALRNIRRSLAPNGRLCMVVWRKREDNPWMHAAELVVKDILPIAEEKPKDAVTCGPGPFSMAGADLVSDQLSKAGFDRVAFERVDRSITIGRDLDDAVDFAMALGPAGEIIRLAEEEGVRRKGDVIAALRNAFAGMQCADGSVRAPSSAWIVTASSPA